MVGPHARETIEPRVMQVLVALARASGETVSRDELIDSCWEGRAVSEDAIHRVISQLRKLGGGPAGGAFEIETVTKVGYRLTSQAQSEFGERPSLAIMPFTNRAGLPEMEALTYGMVEDIASAISLCSFVRVLASSTTRAWAGKTPDLRVLGRELGARYVLEGNVRRIDHMLRVAVQLIEAETGAILWAGHVERPDSELAGLQEDLVKEVAARLGVQVHEIEMARALRKPSDITAYEALQRALALWYNLTLATLPAVVTEARRAVSIVADYAPAHGLLAYALALQFLWTGATDETLKHDAISHARRAVALDPHDPTVLAFAAGALNCLDLLDEAFRHAQRAVEVNPNFPIGQQQLGLVCLRLGHNDEAVGCFDVVEDLSPGHSSLHFTYLRRAHAHFQAGRIEQAMADMEGAFRLNSGYAPTLVLRAALCTLSGRDADAADCVQRIRAMEPNTPADAHVTRVMAWLHPTQSAALVEAFRQSYELHK